MLYRFFTFLLFILLITPAFSQQKDIGFFSLKRLSVQADFGYWDNPWNSYNQIVTSYANRLKYDIYYKDPAGYVEKINGDVEYSLALNYAVWNNFFTTLQLSNITTSTTNNLYQKQLTPHNNGFDGQAYYNKMELNIPSVSLNIGYRYIITNRISVFSSIGVGFYASSLKFNIKYKGKDQIGPLSTSGNVNNNAIHYSTYAINKIAHAPLVTHNVNLTSNDIGYQMQLGIETKIWKSLSFLSTIKYRYLEVDNLSQNYTYNNKKYNIILVKNDTYFGPAEGDTRLKNSIFRDYIFRHDGNLDNRINEKGILDMTAFGLEAGIKWEF